ncbi:hypothetical protein FKP32DRAFT_691229 [Trametes sanguinea]|nr:hypothetical protein FKP32DRAFT_691229 [Trametes sanguinea]
MQRELHVCREGGKGTEWELAAGERGRFVEGRVRTEARQEPGQPVKHTSIHGHPAGIHPSTRSSIGGSAIAAAPSSPIWAVRIWPGRRGGRLLCLNRQAIMNAGLRRQNALCFLFCHHLGSSPAHARWPRSGWDHTLRLRDHTRPPLFSLHMPAPLSCTAVSLRSHCMKQLRRWARTPRQMSRVVASPRACQRAVCLGGARFSTAPHRPSPRAALARWRAPVSLRLALLAYRL